VQVLGDRDEVAELPQVNVHHAASLRRAAFIRPVLAAYPRAGVGELDGDEFARWPAGAHLGLFRLGTARLRPKQLDRPGEMAGTHER
jgi:hypothetical protein